MMHLCITQCTQAYWTTLPFGINGKIRIRLRLKLGKTPKSQKYCKTLQNNATEFMRQVVIMYIGA